MIPTLNGGARFRACLASLAAQRPQPVGVAVIDSGSRDGSAEAARAAGARVQVIAQQDFDHGLSRNAAAAALPEADVLVFLVQDAVPQGSDCLERLATAALSAGTAAATARQVPPPEAGWLTAATVSASPFATAEPVRTGPFARSDVAGWTPAAWRARLRLDDVACAVRADLFRAVGGFPRTPHGEDALLAFDLLSAGWALQHEPAAVVEHGHAYEPAGAAARYAADARFFRERFGLRVRSGPLAQLKGYLAETRRDRHWLDAHPEIPRRAAVAESRRLRWAQVRAQCLGSRGPLGALPVPRPLPAPPNSGASAAAGAQTGVQSGGTPRSKPGAA
ncbi:MAG: glycosyltransferase family 2 protein [Planctomycetota bacterium]